eukprot:13087009-Alexandrium_andersonii.AAC.1
MIFITYLLLGLPDGGGKPGGTAAPLFACRLMAVGLLLPCRPPALRSKLVRAAPRCLSGVATATPDPRAAPM